MPGTFNRFDLQLDDRQANSLVYLFQSFGVPRQSLGERCLIVFIRFIIQREHEHTRTGN